MSVVWLALDTYSQEQVALKIMTGIPEDDRRNQKARERFHREIDIARMLQHPHILPILDYGYMEYEQHRVPYLVSPYVGDRSLAEIFKNNPPWLHWSLVQIADALMQAGESLWYLHSRQPPVVHEDVKPGNFLCRLEERPERMAYLYLCDFGISRWQQDELDMASELLGTFQFMAPEQFERKVDCASDQYALAVMACYMLTGKLPIQAPTHDLYPEAHMHERPLPPSVLNSRRIQSQAIDEIILRALEKKPVKRYPSVIAFVRALHQAIMQYAQDQASAPTDQEQDISQLETIEYRQDGVTSGRPDAAFGAGFADLAIVLDPPDTQEGRVLDEPLPAKPARVVVSSRPDEEHHFTPLPQSEPIRLFLPARPRQLTWSPDGTSLAGVLYGHVPVVIRGSGTIQPILTTRSDQTSALCWSPESTVVAVASRGEIRFWDVVAQSALPLVLNFNVRAIEALHWSSQHQLAVWLADQILIYPLEPSHLRATATIPPRRIATNGMRCSGVEALCWSPDGALLAAGATNGSIRCWSSSLGFPWQITSEGQKVSALTWAPDGSSLLAAFRDNRVVGWDVRSRQEALCWRYLPAMPRSLAMTTTKRIIIASSERRLLVGRLDDKYPTHTLPGQLLAATSPCSPELATLDEQREHVLTIWREQGIILA